MLLLDGRGTIIGVGIYVMDGYLIYSAAATITSY